MTANREPSIYNTPLLRTHLAEAEALVSVEAQALVEASEAQALEEVQVSEALG